MNNARKLYRSEENKIIGGVFGGIGEYFDVDPVLIRLAFAVILVFTAFIPGIVFYLLALIIIPRRPEKLAS